MIDPNNIDLKLRTFLVKNNALKQFIKNCIKMSGRINKETCISTAFNWDSSPEGHEFWRLLSNQWTDQTYGTTITYTAT